MRRWEVVDPTGWVRRCEYVVGAVRANAVAFELRRGELLLISPPAGADAEEALRELDEAGQVTAIVAPNGYHRAGLPAAEAHYPGVPIFVEPRALARVARVCRDRARVRPFAELAPRLPAELEVFVPPHLKRPDTMARLATPQGTLWYVNDLLTNIERLAGARGRVMRLLGYREGLALNRVGGRWLLVADAAACSGWLCAELRRHPPAILLTGHGPPIRDAERLRGLQDVVARGLA